MRVVEVGAIARSVSSEELRERLKQASRESAERGEAGRVLSADRIDYEVARFAGAVRVAVEEFAVLEDGRHVLTQDRHGECTIDLHGGFATTTSEAASDLVDLDMRPSAAVLKDTIRELLCDTKYGVAPWGRLITALADHGVLSTHEQLNTLPFSVQITPDLSSRLRE